MSANFFGVDFLGAALKFTKGKKNSSVDACLRPPENVKLAFSRLSLSGTAKKCTKSEMQVQSCCFDQQTYCFFYVLAVLTLVVAKAPSLFKTGGLRHFGC